MRLNAMMVVVALTTSCALRPRYRDFVSTKTEGKQVALRLTDAWGAPISSAKIEMSEWKNRLVMTTEANGTFLLPVDKKYVDENPTLVVQLPPGVTAYRVALAPLPVAPVPSATPPVEAPPSYAPTPVPAPPPRFSPVPKGPLIPGPAPIPGTEPVPQNASTPTPQGVVQ
jgi:hypothetical protein